MGVSVKPNNKGFSLISVLVAMFIFLVAMLGLLAGIMCSRHIQTRNLLRNEAIEIAQEVLDEYRADNYTNVINSNTVTCEQCLINPTVSSGCKIFSRQINNSNHRFAVLFIEDNSSNGTWDNVTVCWKYRGYLYQRKFSTFVLNKKNKK